MWYEGTGRDNVTPPGCKRTLGTIRRTREEWEQIAEVGPGCSTLWVTENPKCLCGNSHKGGKKAVISLTNIAIVVVVAINEPH